MHAAWRLANLIHTIRKNSPQETINVVGHSQGTMVSMLAMLTLKEHGMRGPEALFVCNSPYSLNGPGMLEAAQYGGPYVVSRNARFNTLEAAAKAIEAAGRSPDALTDDDLEKLFLSTPQQKPWVTREQYGSLYVYANAHDRVMGANVLRSIGWRGLNAAEHGKLKCPNVKGRMFAENIEVGKGEYSYTMSAAAFGITKDDAGRETGKVCEDYEPTAGGAGNGQGRAHHDRPQRPATKQIHHPRRDGMGSGTGLEPVPFRCEVLAVPEKAGRLEIGRPVLQGKRQRKITGSGSSSFRRGSQPCVSSRSIAIWRLTWLTSRTTTRPPDRNTRTAPRTAQKDSDKVHQTWPSGVVLCAICNQ